MTTAKICLFASLLLFLPLRANADFVTVSLAPVANEIQYRFESVPVGQVTLGGVPFDIPTSGNNSWSSHYGTTIGVRSTTAMVLPMNVYGAATVHTLINLGWGVFESSTVTATFIGTGGANYSVDLVTGTDVRNWLDTPYCCNSINGTTTIQVFEGVPSIPDFADSVGRIDKQAIKLPASFATETLTKFILVDNGVSGDVTNTIYDNSESQRSLIYGVTVEIVPEPASLSVWGVAISAVLGVDYLRRRRRCR